MTELESNRAKLNEALDLAQLGHWEYAYATRIIQTSDVHRRVLHLPGPVPRSFYLSRIHPDDRELVRRQLQSVGVSTDRIDFAHRWLAPDGRQLLLHVQGALRRDAEGQPETLVGSIQDVTER